MTMSDWIDDLRAACAAFLREWRARRWLRGGWRNPDELPF